MMLCRGGDGDALSWLSPRLLGCLGVKVEVTFDVSIRLRNGARKKGEHLTNTTHAVNAPAPKHPLIWW